MDRSGFSGRREFLLQSAAVLGSWAVPQSLRRLLAAPVRSIVAGGLLPAPDETTGLPLLMLSEGFRYLSFGWTGDLMSDGVATPDQHDGMGIIADAVLCEDGDRVPQNLQTLTRAGHLTEFAAMNVQLNGERNRLRGDFRDSEWAGATFSPDGKWLFVNNQVPGITFAITGDWQMLGI